MDIWLTDLKCSGLEILVDSKDWPEILNLLRPLKLLDDETLRRMETRTGRVEIPAKVARRIGERLERKLLQDTRVEPWVAPVIPDYIVPIATSNGLWIDPALPLLHRRMERSDNDNNYTYLEFAGFCLDCSGFSVD